MTIIQSVPLGDIPDWFDHVAAEMDTFLGLLIQRWASIDTSVHYELTCNFINNEMGLGDDDAEDFLNGAVNELVRVGADIRAATETGRLLAFTVSRYVVLLTFSEELSFPPPPTYIPPLRATHMTTPTAETSEVSPDKVVVSVTINGLVIIGRRFDLRRLKLLSEDSAEKEVTSDYFREAWVMVYENSDQLDPALVYTESRELIVPLMEMMDKQFPECLVTLEAGLRGVKLLLGVPDVGRRYHMDKPKAPVPVVPPLPWAEMSVGTFHGVELCGTKEDFQKLGIPTRSYESPTDPIPNPYLAVSFLEGIPAATFWAWDVDSLEKVGPGLSAMPSVFCVGDGGDGNRHNLWHHGAYVPPRK